MQLRVIAVGTRMPAWVTEGWQQYAGRMPKTCPLLLLEIPLTHRSGAVSTDVARDQEGEKILRAIKPGHRVVALEVLGKLGDTDALATRFSKWRGDSNNVDFVIGGPDGLAPAVLERADENWSLSPLTLPHGMTRIVVAEQLYRAWTISQGHPYHRS
ncbi:MAG: 23S rRNA (pseudouridine(1915)-N(3))-methyltransferase RlmH [Gammaproteobacteria bacterium]|nr:23S rRNA (pseudouridine(1915)-N(3))-methyltransferase RlmH [Gammaproteobacteria bacterium]NNF66069.1 23S rRNA (pseudouridine(1915)-N(3))-methyltransferase RlmH [Gammaproteobacteria bacterium]